MIKGESVVRQELSGLDKQMLELDSELKVHCFELVFLYYTVLCKEISLTLARASFLPGLLHALGRFRELLKCLQLT